MYSGKSTRLQIDYNVLKQAGLKCIIVRPAADTRSPQQRVRTHDGWEQNAHEFVSVEQALAVAAEQSIQVVLIDEAQFIPGLARLCNELEQREISVVLAALNQDFLGQPWPEIAPLLHTFEVRQTFAVCKYCSNMRATCSHLISNATPNSEGHIIGSTKDFIALCRPCWLRQPKAGTPQTVSE